MTMNETDQYYKIRDGADGGKYVLVKDIAQSWYPRSVVKVPTTEVARYLISKGVSVKKVRVKAGDASLRGKWLLCYVVSALDLEEVKSKKEGMVGVVDVFDGSTSKQSTLYQSSEDSKYSFYIIQKYPKKAPSIIKMGKTGRSVEQRASEYNVFEPKILLEFPIDSYDEKTVMKMIANGAEQLGQEEFWIEDIEGLLERAKKVQEFLPKTAVVN